MGRGPNKDKGTHNGINQLTCPMYIIQRIHTVTVCQWYYSLLVCSVLELGFVNNMLLSTDVKMQYLNKSHSSCSTNTFANTLSHFLTACTYGVVWFGVRNLLNLKSQNIKLSQV